MTKNIVFDKAISDEKALSLSIKAVIDYAKNRKNNAIQRIDAIASLLEMSARLAKDSGTQTIAEKRRSTSDFYSVRQKGVGRERLNLIARKILNQYRNGEVSQTELTNEQKLALAQYSGCGGGLLNADGTKGSAYEYYTPKPVAEGIWDALKGMGFNGGKVLDPCAGAGIFGATAPLNCVIDAVELSEESGLVNKLVNEGPGYTVKISPFEAVASKTPDEIYDAVVTNVPFGDVADRGSNALLDPRYQDEPLETYFILRCLEKLRPGGTAAFIVPPRCMDGKGAKQRKLRLSASYLAEFVGSYRLPSGTFSSANTETMTDVMFFRKFQKDMAEKIESLASTDAKVLNESKVLWDKFIDGKYYETSEGHPYVLGTFVAKDPEKFRDTDKVISNASLTDLREILQTKRLPKSRIDWEALELAETQAIEYKDGDHITQAGVTYEMQDGVWVVISNDSKTLAGKIANQSIVRSLKTPYNAWEAELTRKQAEEAVNYASAMSDYESVPQWVMDALNETKEKANTEKFWRKSLIALSCVQVLEERSGDNGVNFLSEYEKLSNDMAMYAVSQADVGRVTGAVKAALSVLRIHYKKADGYSDFWRGVVAESVESALGVDESTLTVDMKYAALRYRTKSAWNSVEDVKAIYGENFNPLESDDWCISADGKSVARAEDVFYGNYLTVIKEIDSAIEKAESDEIRAKLVREKLLADERVNRLDVSRVNFSLHSPYVTVEEKVEFLKQFVSENAIVDYDQYNRAFPDIQTKGNSDFEKIKNRLGDYLKNGSITLGGAKFDNWSKEQALNQLCKLIQKTEAQFDVWAKSNAVIVERLNQQANDPKKLRFNPSYDNAKFDVAGMNPSLHLHDYQCDFVRKMGREFGGINGFGVGLGKTFTALAAVQHVQSIGAKKKTFFVVPNSVLSNWMKEAERAYASMNDCLFIGLRKGRDGKMKVKSSAYAEDLHRVAENKHSKIFMSIEAFQAIRLKEETVDTYFDYMMSNDESFAATESHKDNVRTEAAASDYKKKLIEGKKETMPYLEDLGVDSIVIDEAHMFKNSSQTRFFEGAKFLSLADASNRGIDAQVKTWYVRGMNKASDGVLLLTATPITNSPLEIYSMLSLAVGVERVNDLMGSTRGADNFMEAVCIKEQEMIESVDGMERAGLVFTKIDNLTLLRRSLNDVATIRDAKSVGMSIHVPEAGNTYESVTLDSETKALLDQYKTTWRAAKRIKAEQESDGDQLLVDRAEEEFGEPVGVTASVFNLISKLTKVIVDPELANRVSVYKFPEDMGEVAAKVVNEFNALNLNEKRLYLPKRLASDETLYTVKLVKNPSTGEQMPEYTFSVYATLTSDNAIQIESSEPKAQDALEAIAEKLNLPLDVNDSPKIAAMLENFKKEQAMPRGIDSDGNVSTSVKQIIFCDFLGTHNKIKRLLTNRCGVPSNKIAIVTGQKNNKPDEIMAIQDGFNAEGEDNLYQVVIANEKAEVGINLQKGTQAIHHLTIGWTPDSIEQRNGRGVRQGNKIDVVNVYYYDADGTFDAMKRQMVNKKSDWISTVTDSNEGDVVKVAGGLTKEDYEALVELGDDPEALAKYEKKKAEQERNRRIQATVDRQKVDIDMVIKQKEFIENNSDASVMAVNRLVDIAQSYWAWRKLSTTIASDEAKDKAKHEKAVKKAEEQGKEVPVYEPSSALQKKKARQEKIAEEVKRMASELDESVEFVSKNDETKKFSTGSVLNYVVDRYEDKVTADRVGWTFKAVVKGGSPLKKRWELDFQSAQTRIAKAKESFAKLSREDGAIPANFIDLYESGDAYFGLGRPIMRGGIAYAKYRGRDAILVVPDGCGGRSGHKFNGAYADPEQAGNDITVWDVGNLDSLGKILYQGDLGFEEALKAAAKIEDSWAAQGYTEKPLSDDLPEILNYRKQKALTRYHYRDVKLPSPYFPYPLSQEVMRRDVDGFLEAICETQQGAFTQDSMNSRYILVDDGSIEVEHNSWEDNDLIAACVLWAKAHNRKVPFPVFMAIKWRSYFGTQPISEESTSVLNDATSLEDLKAKLSEVMANIYADVNFDGVGEDVLLNCVPETIMKPYEEVLEKFDPRKPDDIVRVDGNTWRWKSEIKQAADDIGESARWNKVFKVWEITYAAWKHLINKYPEAKNQLKID